MVTRRWRRSQGGAAVLGLALLAVGLAPGTAGAARQVAEGSTTATEACKVSLGSVTADGDHAGQDVTATISADDDRLPDRRGRGVPGRAGEAQQHLRRRARHSGDDISGLTILGDSMYDVAYETFWGGETDPVGRSAEQGRWWLGCLHRLRDLHPRDAYRLREPRSTGCAATACCSGGRSTATASGTAPARTPGSRR